MASHSVDDGTIHLYDMESGELIHKMRQGVRFPSSLAFSPDGRTLAIGHADGSFSLGAWGSVTLRDAKTLEFKHRLGVRPDGMGNFGAVESVSFSPDGRVLAVARSADPFASANTNTVRLWDPATGAHLGALEGHTGNVNSVTFSPDGRTLAGGSSDGTVTLWQITSQVKPDVNGDGVVDMRDLVLVAGRLGLSAVNPADVNGDGTVNTLDLVLVAGMADDSMVSLPMVSNGEMMLHTTQVREWLEESRRLDLADPAIPRGIEYLQNLLEAVTPERTALLPNFPNPFNPETWIPYQLARDSVVRISIYSSTGILVRHLDLGLQPEGYYTDKHYAAYWDGRNDGGELLASGVYIYVFHAGSYHSARHMAIVR